MARSGQSGEMTMGALNQEKIQKFAEAFKTARQSSGASIESIAYETKISKQFVMSLEAGDLQSLPGRVFGRGFVKSIQRFLRTQNQDLLSLYEACWQEDSIANTVESVVKVARGTEAPSPGAAATKMQKTSVKKDPAEVAAHWKKLNTGLANLSSAGSKALELKQFLRVPDSVKRAAVSPQVRLMMLATVAGVMAIGVLMQWITTRGHQSKMHPAPRSVTAGVSQKSTAESHGTVSNEEMINDVVADNPVVLPRAASEKTVTIPTTVAKDTPALTANVSEPVTSFHDESPLAVAGGQVAFEQTIALKVTEPVQVKLTLDGKRVVNGDEMAPGEYSYTFRSKAEMNISDASAVDVVYNQKSLGSLGSKGRRRKIAFQAQPKETDFPF
jgi:hypothetical protein